ncbi:unnamed protein product [Durusdinium trenchii]|uniref:Uncharacterized protein n=2 Tax=Durusdinium trenchii TaxID=1381693 RepID=A0ABP0KT70_9DINO
MLGRCNSEPVLRKKLARDPAETRFLSFLNRYSQKHRCVSRAQTQPNLEKQICRSPASLPSSAARQRPKSGPVPATPVFRRPSSAISRTDSPKVAAIRERVLSRIATGLHVALLGAKVSQKPGETKLEQPIGRASVQQVQRIYRHFLRLKAIEADRAAEVRYWRHVKLVQEAWSEQPKESEPNKHGYHEDGCVPATKCERPSHIPRLQWATFFHWLEQEASCGIQQTYRRTLAALLRGVKLWKELCASAQQSLEGISLGLLLSWVYPASSNIEISQMLSWLGGHQLDCIRWKSPRLIDDDERKQLERIFQNVYAKGRHAITPDDIAGGPFPDRQTRLLTLVDARLARHVFGDRQIDWPMFAEHMCEIGCQGHPQVTRVTTPEGIPLVRCQRDPLNFHGWLSETPPESEVESRKVIDAFEEEVIAWQSGTGY